MKIELPTGFEVRPAKIVNRSYHQANLSIYFQSCERIVFNISFFWLSYELDVGHVIIEKKKSINRFLLLFCTHRKMT